MKPKALQKGDRIAIVSLSSGILGEPFCAHQRTLGEARLRAFGLEAVYMKHTLDGSVSVHDHPELRAKDLKDAFADPSIQGILCVIGGDDTFRTLSYLLDDPEFIHLVQQYPKVFTGYSDTTINHLMFQRLGMTSYYGLNFLTDLAELDTEMLPYTQETLHRYFSDQPNFEILSSPIWYEEREDFSKSALGTPRISHPETHGYLVLRGQGVAEGTLFGGCLESIYDMLSGERYADEPSIIRKYHLFPTPEEMTNRILFLETSEEQPSPNKFREMLMRLDQEGILNAPKAILVGKPQNERYFEEYQSILLDCTKKGNIPILYNLNFGHAHPKTVLPLGVKAKVDFNQKRIFLLESMFDDSMK